MVAKLRYNLATVHWRLGDLGACEAECSQALELAPGYAKALHRRAVCRDAGARREEACHDWGRLCGLEPGCEEYQEGYRQARRARAREERKDYYDILQIKKEATLEDVKKAYRHQAMRHHPDKHAEESEEAKKDHEQKFKDVAEAFTVLSDTKLRWNFDNCEGEEDGWDLDEEGNIDSEAIWSHLFGDGTNTSYINLSC